MKPIEEGKWKRGFHKGEKAFFGYHYIRDSETFVVGKKSNGWNHLLSGKGNKF